MSTHDYVIDNQSAPAFRADLNNVLAAIASQNSSGTAPTVTFANMIWYDTTANQIKKRNEANSAWITLGTVDETAGTFTPSGERALATQVQAEAGTDNATLMTPLRAAQAIAALTPTTAGAVGTYGFLCQTSVVPTALVFGGSYSGSSFRFSALASNPSNGSVFDFGTNDTLVASGTWRCMGATNDVNGTLKRHTLFLRIA